MKRLALLLILPFIGCASAIPPVEPVRVQPEVVSIVPLPPYSSTLPIGGLRIIVILHVMEDGTVGEAKMIQSSKDDTWDSLAMSAIRRWKFAAARQDEAPVATWVRQTISVRFETPIVRNIGEVVFSRYGEAERFHAELIRGAELESMIRAGDSVMGGHFVYLGSVDLCMFPGRIRDQIQLLGKNDVSSPIRVGDEYMVFKRYGSDGPRLPGRRDRNEPGRELPAVKIPT
jgi:TonB family protein